MNVRLGHLKGKKYDWFVSWGRELEPMVKMIEEDLGEVDEDSLQAWRYTGFIDVYWGEGRTHVGYPSIGYLCEGVAYSTHEEKFDGFYVTEDDYITKRILMGKSGERDGLDDMIVWLGHYAAFDNSWFVAWAPDKPATHAGPPGTPKPPVNDDPRVHTFDPMDAEAGIPDLLSYIEFNKPGWTSFTVKIIVDEYMGKRWKHSVCKPTEKYNLGHDNEELTEFKIIEEFKGPVRRT